MKSILLAALCLGLLACANQSTTNTAQTPGKAVTGPSAKLMARTKLGQRWVYVTGNVGSEAGYNKLIDILDQTHAIGGTHILLGEGQITRLAEAKPEYFERVKQFLAEAQKRNIDVIPYVFPTGYSGAFLSDPNMASGIPARNMPFVVRNGSAEPQPDSAPVLVNAGFEEVDNKGVPAGWTLPADSSSFISVDKTEKHSGSGALKIANLENLPKEAKGDLHVVQNFKVQPFQYYRLSMWVKTQGLKASSQDYVLARNADGSRRLAWTDLGVESTQDWKKMEIVLNTTEATEVKFALGVGEASAGTIWFDDVKLEPAGLLRIVRREITPLKVTSADGKTVYTEGRDFTVAAPGTTAGSAPRMSSTTQPATQPTRRGRRGGEASTIELATGSRIQDGQKLLVSFYHPMTIYGGQDVATIQDPQIFKLMEDQMNLVAKYWPCKGYFIKCDEVRVGGWEVQPDGEHLTPGQLLGRYIHTGIGYIHKYAPDADVYIWSDMFTPYHNARPFKDATHEGAGYYYMAAGNYDGAWDGLTPEVIVANWYSPDDRTPKFLAQHGHRQLLAGFYDGKTTQQMKDNIHKWIQVTAGVPGVTGIMYTTWHNDFAELKEYFHLLDTYGQWKDEMKAAEGQPGK